MRNCCPDSNALVTGFWQGLDIILVLAKFSSVNENSADPGQQLITPLVE